MIETERLRLRAPRPEDFDASHAMWSDLRTVEHIGGVPSTRQQSWLRILTSIGHWNTLPYGPLVAEEKTTGAFAGEVGLFHFKRSIEPSIDAFPEAGWVFSPAMQGRGYATEAVRGLLAWADVTLDAPQTVAIVTVDNIASIRVAEKVGFHEWQRTTFNDMPVVLFKRERPASPTELRGFDRGA
jgi:RimJ/RimL family protein N-acetyltransferase